MIKTIDDRKEKIIELLDFIFSSTDSRSDLRSAIPMYSKSDIRSALGSLLCWVAAKTQVHFERVLRGSVLDLYDGDISKDEFIDGLAELISQQFGRAWNEGMRANGLDPQADMTDAWKKVLDDRIADEYNYVDAYAASIAQAAKDGKPVDQFLNRASMWAARYSEVVDLAKLTTGEDNQLYRWQYGDTVEHCTTCAEQANQVRTAAEWRELRDQGIYPQSRDLECGGWNCDCSIVKA